MKCRLCVKTHVRERVPGSALGTTLLRVTAYVCKQLTVYKHYGLEVQINKYRTNYKAFLKSSIHPLCFISLFD